MDKDIKDDYSSFFSALTQFPEPYAWQLSLASCDSPQNRLIRIPTAFGKTAGTILTWLYHRAYLNDNRWPRRLVYNLPRRTLVEQTVAEVREWLSKAGLLWDGNPNTHAGKVGVHILIGGSDSGDWHLYPEECAILIGTQDMELSRALNRGYASPRARWPMEFGLLNQDTLWIMDEVQIMDVGLSTSSQLQQFRDEDCVKGVRPSFSWWMSATLQPDWLISVDTVKMVDKMVCDMLTIPPEQRRGHLWDDVSKPISVKRLQDTKALARLAAERHAALQDGEHGRITLIVLNRVDRAREVYQYLLKDGRTAENTKLVYNKFRGEERRQWLDVFLSRDICKAGKDMMIVATQVVEAGVDISGRCLITDLASWPSLVQRFGRAARFGGTAEIIVIDFLPPGDDWANSEDGKKAPRLAAPYENKDLLAAREALKGLADVSQKSLELFESGLSDEERKKLYPYSPMHLLLRKELDQFFDTTPDLTGADIDIGRFIRTGDEHDCQVFWDEWTGEKPPATLQPVRDALCAVPVGGKGGVIEWLFGKGKIKDEMKGRVFVWDYLEDEWFQPRPDDIVPGKIVLVAPCVGGYSTELGFTGEKPLKGEKPVPVVKAASPQKDSQSDNGQDNEALSVGSGYQTIATHGYEVSQEVAVIARAVGVSDEIVGILSIAGRYHDLGKNHPTFRGRIVSTDAPSDGDLAKAPKDAWRRPGPHMFRHELASALAVIEMLARTRQDHPALLGECKDLIDAGAFVPELVPTREPNALEKELQDLSSEQFNLLVYLICSHHGKVRVSLQACPSDQASDDSNGMPMMGVRDGDSITGVRIYDSRGEVQVVEGLELHLDPALLGLSGRYGPSWRERSIALQSKHGSFALAFLEALLRAADIRVSMRKPDSDPLLEKQL